MTVRTIDEIFRDFVTDGVPASGPFNPHKPDIRDTLKALTEGGDNFPDNRVIRLNNADEGTANNIVVTASVAIPAAAYQVLYILNVTQENTGPVTISGAINRKLVTNTSEPVPAGYLKPGMAVLCIDTGSELRMLSYGDVEKAVEDLASQAEAAKFAAEQAKDQAQNAASDAVSQGNVPIYSTRNAVETLEIPAGINAFRTNGYASPGDGGGAMYKRVASEPSHAGKVQSADGAWWEEVKRDGSRSFWQTQRVPLAVASIRTTGYNSEGDLGDALYKRVATQPPHAGWFQTADGAYWELAQTDIRAAVFGAFPETNATGQLQNALTFLRLKGGGHLFVNEGTYEITSTLSIGSNTTIELHGSAVIKRMANIDCMLLSYSDGVTGGYNASRNIIVEGGAWDHNASAFPSAGSAIAFGHCTRPIVRNTTILDVSGRWHAIECNACTRAIFENNVFNGGGNDETAGECIQIDGAYEGGAFPWYAPYDNTTCDDITIRNNQILNWATGIGSHTVVGTNRHENIKIQDNVIEFSRYGIAIFNWAGSYIKGNRILGRMTGAGGNQYGIYCYPSGNAVSDVVITQNTLLTIKRDTTQAGGSRGIFFLGTVATPTAMRNIRITENFIQDVGRHAIVLEGCTSYTVANNQIADVGGRGVYVYGSSQGVTTGNRISSGNSDPAITVVAVGSAGATSNIVTDNLISGANGGISVTTQWAVVVNNITPVLTKTGAGGILGPNWVNGALVA